MAIALVNERAIPPTPALPMTLELKSSRSSTVVAATFIAMAATVLLAPFSLLAASAAQDPKPFLSTLQQPAIALQLGIALIVAVIFVALPARRLLRRNMQPHVVTVTADQVSARHPKAALPVWSEPLSAYRGVAHHIRTSLSGAQHELVLVHTDRARSVVLATADRIGQSEIDAMAALLLLGEVPARTLYRGHNSSATQLLAA